MALTAEMSRRIEERIDAFIASQEWLPDMRDIAAQLRALPLYADMGGCIALRPDGEVLLVEWDGPMKGARHVLDAVWSEYVLRSGAGRYPKLAEVWRRR